MKKETKLLLKIIVIMMEENNDILLDGVDALVYLGTTSIPNLSRKTSK